MTEKLKSSNIECMNCHRFIEGGQQCYLCEKYIEDTCGNRLCCNCECKCYYKHDNKGYMCNECYWHRKIEDSDSDPLELTEDEESNDDEVSDEESDYECDYENGLKLKKKNDENKNPLSNFFSKLYNNKNKDEDTKELKKSYEDYKNNTNKYKNSEALESLRESFKNYRKYTSEKFNKTFIFKIKNNYMYF